MEKDRGLRRSKDYDLLKTKDSSVHGRRPLLKAPFIVVIIISALAHYAPPAGAGIQDHLPGDQFLDGVLADLFFIRDRQFFA